MTSEKSDVPRMSDAAKNKRREYMREYMREWRKKHPEKTAEYNRQYWERKSCQDSAAVEG